MKDEGSGGGHGWGPQDGPRSTFFPSGVPDKHMPPWHMDHVHRPPGRDFKASPTEPKFDEFDEFPIAEYLRHQGNDIWPIRKSPNFRCPDASIGAPHPFVGKPKVAYDYVALRNSITCLDFKRETSGSQSHMKVGDMVIDSLGLGKKGRKAPQARKLAEHCGGARSS